MLRKIIFLFTLLSTSIPQGSTAQQCGYDYHNMFIIDIRDAGEKIPSKNIQVFLVDDQLNLVYENVSVKEKKGYRSESRPVEIVPNAQRKSRGTKEFPRAEDYHIVLISSKKGPKAPTPVYFAQIIQNKDTSYYRLPYERSLNICANKIYSDHKIYQERKMIQENGEDFVPILIDLSIPETPLMPEFPLDNIIIRYIFEQEKDLKSGKPISEEKCVKKIEILDYHTLFCIQELKPTEAYYFTPRDAHQHIKEIDVFGDNPPGIKDFIITYREENIGPGKWLEIYRDYFLFNERKQGYDRWTSLSEYPNVIVDLEGFPSRHTVEDVNSERIKKFYIFNGENWKLDRTTTEYLEPEYSQEAPKVNLPPTHDLSQCLSFIGGNEQMRKVVYGNSDEYGHVIYKDTLYIQNRCDKALGLKITGATAPDYFKFPKAIGPGRQMPVPFQIEEMSNDDQISKYTQYGGVISSFEENLSLSLSYFVAGKNTAIFDDTGSKIIKFKSKSTNGMSAFVVEVDENSKPLSSGNELLNSDKRVGQWIFYSADGKVESSIQYDKLMMLLLINGPENWDNIKPEIRENGIWKTPAHINVDKGFRFYCNEAVDSIRVITDEGKGECLYNFKESNNNSGAQLYIIKPNQDFIYSYGSKMPITYSEQYKIRWDYAAFPNGFLNYPNELIQQIEKIRKRFPDVNVYLDDPYENNYTLDLTGTSPERKKEIQNYIIENPYVLGLSQMVTPGNIEPTYADFLISIVFHNSTIPSQFKDIVEKYGFTQLTQTFGTTHLYTAKYTGKICDREFYAAINALSRESGIVNVGPEFFLHITHDNYIDGNMQIEEQR